MKRSQSIFRLFIMMSALFPKVYTEWCEKSSTQPHSRLKDDVLCDYDPYIRPKLEHRNATTVKVRMILKSFNYDMHSHCFTINAWTTLFWEDDHLKWNPADYQGIESAHFATDSIWTPDLSHYNRFEQDGSHDIINEVNCHALYTGKVVCVTPGKYDTLCTADLKNFPYDKQTCTFIIGSWVHTGEELSLDFFQTAIDLQELTPNPEWDLVNVDFQKRTEVDDCCPNSTFPSLSYIFMFQRRGSFLQTTAIIPCLGLIIMTLSILFLDAKETERITLIVCDIISHIMYIQYLSWNVPSFGEVPKIILFARDSVVIVFALLLITIILRNLVKSPEESPNWAMEVVSKAIGSRVGHMVLVFDFTMKNIAKVKMEEDGENIIDNVQPNIQKDCTLFTKLVDRMCFVLFLVIYLIMIVLFLL